MFTHTGSIKETQVGKVVSESNEKICLEPDKSVFNQAYRRLGCVEDAEEVANDVRLEVLEKYDPSHESGASQKTFEYAICENLCKKRLREKKGKLVSLEALLELPEALYRDQFGKYPYNEHGLDSTERQEVRELLEKAIRQLSPKQQKAISLRFFDGLSYAQIGKIFSTTAGYAKQLVYRALSRLQMLCVELGLDEYLADFQ